MPQQLLPWRFGPVEAAAVITAIDGRAPVGIPSYGYVGVKAN